METDEAAKGAAAGAEGAAGAAADGAKKDKEPEPTSFTLENPARVVPGQVGRAGGACAPGVQSLLRACHGMQTRAFVSAYFGQVYLCRRHLRSLRHAPPSMTSRRGEKLYPGIERVSRVPLSCLCPYHAPFG